MEKKIKGKNVVIKFFDNGTYKGYLCARECNIEVNTEILETSEVGAGDWATYKGIKNSWSGNITGLNVLPVASNSSSFTFSSLRDNLQKSKSKIPIKFERTDEAGNTNESNGVIIITSSSEDAPYNNLNTFSIKFIGVGPLNS